METNIRLTINIKRKLNSMKIHSRESYNDVIARVIGNMKKSPNGQMDVVLTSWNEKLISSY